MRFTGEQQEFARQIRDFCAKELGTLALRDAVTEGGTLANSPEILKKMAALGWLGVSVPTE